jgi:uncharacterized protein YegP (UPF0339 family)
MSDQIVDYVEIVQDDNGTYRVRARSSNGEIIWTTEQYESREHALAIANDSGRPLREEDMPA